MTDSRGGVRSFQAFLRKNQLLFACAESCTGGLLSQQMTALAGSSEVFWGGAVTYANEAKQTLLGVSPTVIANHGAVSEAVATSMVRGLVQVSGVPLAVSITGVAGPGGGSPEKPVGTVWFGVLAFRDQRRESVAVRCVFPGSRVAIQRQASRMARLLALWWWESSMDLDRFQSLADNERKSSIEAFQLPLLHLPNSF